MASYYISPSGSNSSGTGSQSNPWATLDHAISRVTTPGDDIRVMAGNYPAISSQMELAQKVSIIGAGRDVTTITLTSTSGGGCIKMESYGQWTNKTIGFQSISGIKFVGSTTSGSPIGHIAISMYYRNHVYIHDCEFVDFVRSAVRFNGQQYWSGFNIDNPYYNGSTSDMLYIPFNNSFAEGNRFYNNIVHNCCGRIGTTNDFSGALEVSVCDGCLVYDNYMTATGRSGNDNGVPIKFIGAGSGFNRNSKIYNNHIIVGHMDTNYWQFAIEIWWDLGGTEVYNNTCEGAIDLCDSWDQYGAGYGIRCYNNDVGYSQNTTNLDRGILFEGTHVDTYVYNNHIHHVARAITHNNNNNSNATIYNNVHVYNNYAHHLSGRDYQTWGMYWDPAVTSQGGLFQNIFIRHNTFHASEDAPGTTMHGIMIPSVTELDSWYLENNIIMNFEYSPIFGSGARDQATNIFMRNNLIYGCGNNNNPVYQSSFPTAGVTFSGTVKSSPQFISSTDFHLQPTSPAIGAGRPTDVTLDYDGNTRSSTAPTIGAYEYTATGITYYVRTDGVNTSSRNGLSPSTAWATLSYASSRVSQSGSTIYVESGNYTDNNRVNLAVGVNVVGNSTTRPNITTSYSATSTIDGYLYLNSASGNAINGNQSISYLRINGNNTNATRAGSVNFRGNVKIHHCEISNFLYSGIRFYGSSSNYNVTPTNVLPTGNEVYNCVFNNCSQRVGSNIGGHIRSECQVGFLLHHNTFIQNSRPVGYNGNIFSGYQNWGLQVYNNVWTKPDNNYTDTLPALDTWNFFMEFHYSHGGIDIYNNEFIGVACVDFAGVEVDEDHYTYGGRVFENTFRSASGGFAPYNPHNEPYIDLESFSYVFDVAIYRNKFSYGRTAIALNNVYSELNYVDIYSNIIENTGNLDNGWDNAIYVSSEWAGSTPVYFSNISIVNNVITAGRNTLSGVGVNVLGTMYRLIIKNNIIYGTFSRPIRFTAPSSITTNQTYIQNNIFYGNNNTSIYYDPNITFLNLDESGNLAGSAYNPIFVGGSPYSYRLSSTSSPAYHAGRYHKILVDFDGNAWNNPPSIGAYEFTQAAATYYVKNGGNDNADGLSDEQAWATINKVNSVTLEGGDRVLFKRGSTWTGESLTPSNSGSSENNTILFSAYGTGNDPLISGFTTLTGWTNYGGNIYYKAISPESAPNVLLIDNISYAKGRYPRTDFLLTDNSSTTSATDADLPSSPDFDGAEIAIRTAEWVLERRTNITHSGQTVTYSSTTYTHGTGNGFIITNHINTLTHHGDWCYANGNVYIYLNSQPTNYTIKVSTRDYTSSILSRDYITIQDITFEGANQAAILVNSSDHITVKNCNIRFNGNFGILNSTAGNYLTVTDNTISFCNDVGISLSNGSTYTTISNNNINHIGYFFGMGGSSDQSYSGIICRGNFSIIEYNNISDVGYDGIAWGGQETIINRNTISNFCMHKGDGGGLYSFRDYNTDKIVSQNIIFNGVNNTATYSNDGNDILYPTSHGIYNDGAYNTTYTNNIVFGNHGAGIFVNACKNTTVTYNTMYDNQMQLYVLSENTDIGRASGHIINNNIMVSRRVYASPYNWMQSCFKLVFRGIANYHDYSVTDYNIYARPINDDNYIDIWPNAWQWSPNPRLNYNLSEWQSYSGEDINSTSTPITISSDSQLHFIYNNTLDYKIYILSANMIDISNISYPAGNITLEPYTSKILIGNGTIMESDEIIPGGAVVRNAKFAHFSII